MVNAAKRLSALICAGAAENWAAESAEACSCGRPVYPRGALYSVAPLVARAMSSPSPTTGLTVYTAHLPSLDSDEPEMVFHSS